MKLTRLFQPRNPLFWIMMALNALSTILIWIARYRSLSTLGIVLVCGFAIANAILGTWLAWHLVKDSPAKKVDKE